jgi:Putative DNA-binding domain
MPTPRELEQLLTNPNEGLTLEHKSWLNLRDDDDKARLAKAAIALANEGGGIIVFGMREGGNGDGGFRSLARPDHIQRYHQDDINAAINRFAEPPLHSELLFAEHPTTQVQHAFAVIAGGAKVPVMSKSGRDKIISQQRCYVRKPGPKSEEPHNAAEWNGVLERCLHNRRENMLDAIRTIVQGHGTPVKPANQQDNLLDFMNASAARWEALRDTLPADSESRMLHGHCELVFEILDVPQAPNYPELQKRLDEARRIKLTGWGPFVTIQRRPYAPSIVNDAIEVWLGHLSDQPVTVDAAHTDYWRVTLDGKLFLLRGYDEDAIGTIAAGTVFDVTLPVWRVGEALLFVARFALLFDQNPNIRLICRYSGLNGRNLTSVTRRRMFTHERVCRDDAIELTTHATASQIDDNLVEILHSMLSPLYERFDFFELSLRLVQEEVERLRAGRF